MKIPVVAIIILLLSAVTAGSQELSNDDKDSAKFMASEFTECMGVYDGLSKYSKKLGSDEAALQMKGLSRGAQWAATHMASLVTDWEKAKLYAENKGAIHSSYWSARIINEGKSPAVQAVVDKCHSYNELQTSIVNSLRENLYGLK